ncbi:hypothetical protein [Paraburkholderia sp. J10-1]|uniref:hypothetical protein n=1 Tax=Paraburkholderia sp. J10-1 TaxID=2805430 RepID=UPI002AB7229B|nr:hypothetical protein [Paraburkholderia sp. J10-1]
MKNVNRSSQERSNDNAERLKAWLKETPIDKVPVNQFGGAARKAICARLAIPRSTIATGKGIQNIFDDLDSQLARHLKAKRTGKPKSRRTMTTVLSVECQRLQQELSRALEKSRRLEYLEATGIYLGQNRV